MARLPSLIDAIALHDRRGKPTIAHIARKVRDKKLIKSDTRGVGAAHMTFSDATTLLLAVCGDSSPQGAVEAVHRLRALQPVPWDDFDRSKREDLPEQLNFLRERMSFADAVEKLLIHAPTVAEWQEAYGAESEDLQSPTEAAYTMDRMARKFGGAVSSLRPGYARDVRVVCYVPGVAAEIHLGRTWKHLEEDNAFHEYYSPPDNQPSSSQGGEDGSNAASISDCLITIEIGLPTLLALHHAVLAPA